MILGRSGRLRNKKVAFVMRLQSGAVSFRLGFPAGLALSEHGATPDAKVGSCMQFLPVTCR
jgi:hypothetical protein